MHHRIGITNGMTHVCAASTISRPPTQRFSWESQEDRARRAADFVTTRDASPFKLEKAAADMTKQSVDRPAGSFRFASLPLCFPVSLVSLYASAATIELPEVNPIVSVTLPESWTSEKTSNGGASQSPDKLFTTRLEVIPTEAAEALVKRNAEWLKKVRNVEVSDVWKKLAVSVVAVNKFLAAPPVEANTFEWQLISLGPQDFLHQTAQPAATYGFQVTDAGDGTILVLHYWHSDKAASSKHAQEATGMTTHIKQTGGMSAPSGGAGAGISKASEPKKNAKSP